MQQEQRKAARSAKAQKEAPKEEIGVQLKKKAPAQKEAAAPEQKEAPKLKKVEKKHGRELAAKTGFTKYIEVSSTEGVNVGKVMETVLIEVENKALWQRERR